MKRQNKYTETDTFHFHNANPKNRATGDCTFRAISVALEQPWEQTVMEMAEMSCKTGYAINDKKGIERYLKSKGWVKHDQPRRYDLCGYKKYTGKQWCYEVQSVTQKRRSSWDRMVAMIGGHHIVAIIDGKVWDIWDSTDGCIGNYWTKP